MLLDKLARKWLKTSETRGWAIEQFYAQDNSENQCSAKPITNELDLCIV